MKIKKLVAVLLAAVIAVSIFATAAFARTVPGPYPDASADVAFEAFHVDGTDKEGQNGTVRIVAASGEFSHVGQYYKIQAIPDKGYQFAYWEVALTIENAEGTVLQTLPNDYKNEDGIYAFGEYQGDGPYNPTAPHMEVNRLQPEKAEAGEILCYTIKAYFRNAAETDTVAVPVTYTYHGKPISDKEEIVYLTEGTHQVPATEASYTEYGFALADPEIAAPTVKVTKDPATGALVANPSSVNFEVLPTIDPADVSFHVSYVDENGNTIPGGGDLYFDEIGPVKGDDLPLPYGYERVIPAHPGEDWLYPTSLKYVDGQWKAVPDTVTLMVREKCHTTVTYQLENGTVVDSYKEYYDSEGGGILEAKDIPEGFEIVGDSVFAVEVTMNDEGVLQADPSEVTFIVKPMEAGECYTTVTYQLKDGTVVGSYKEVFTSEGGGVLEAKNVPEGYKIVGRDLFAVEVSYNALGKLEADPSEVVFVVEPVSSVPDEDNASSGEKPDTNVPQTGDYAPIGAAALLAVSAMGILVTMKKKSYNR